ERHSEDPFALGHAIEELALASNADPEERARLLVEAAQTALAAGDAREAARRSEIAARLAPTHADAQLLKHTLAYRRGGAGDAEQARLTILALRGIVGELSPEQEELRSFLLAEALDVVPEEGSGLEELESVLARLGPRPLIALGVAERAARAKDFQRAQRFYERALSGDFRDLRNRAEAALNAATTARALGELELALVLAESAARDPKHQSEAAALIEQLRTQGSGPPPASLQEPPEVLTRRSFMPQGDDSAASAAGRPDPVVEIARPVRPGRELAHTMKSKTGHELLLQASETDSAESDVAADNAREHGAPLEHAETAAESEHAESEHAESELAESSERAAQRLARGSHTRD